MADAMKGGTTESGSLADRASWRERRSSLAGRLSRVRVEACGKDGVPELARRLGLPARTWWNYEAGVTIPGEVLLAFLEVTGVDPARLAGAYGESGEDVPD